MPDQTVCLLPSCALTSAKEVPPSRIKTSSIRIADHYVTVKPICWIPSMLNPTATEYEPSEGSMKQLSVRAVIGAVVTATTLTGQSVAVRLPDESAGIGGIARALVSAFDQVDVLALGEAHGRTFDSDLRLAIVRRPDFPNKVRSIVVEFGSTTEQVTLDRYIQGENVSHAQLEQVWKSTTQARTGVWDSPIYAEFFAAVRDVNAKLPVDSRMVAESIFRRRSSSVSQVAKLSETCSVRYVA